MNSLKFIALGFILFIVSEIILVYLGKVQIYFIFFIPVFVSNSFLSIIPFILLIIPFMISFLNFKPAYKNFQEVNYDNEHKYYQGKKEKNFGGFILIGPVPIMFGSKISRNLLYILILIAVLIMILYIFFAR